MVAYAGLDAYACVRTYLPAPPTPNQPNQTNQSGPLGGGFGNGGWETNTLVSDTTTVICLDDYHANDRAGRKVTGRTALEGAEQNFDLMYEQLKALKEGKTVAKPIYNHVNGTLDRPEEIVPTPIVIVEGLHPWYDQRVKDLLDYTIYLDISDEIKRAWKIQRDMAERGWTLEQIEAEIEKRKPDFDKFVGPQKQVADAVIQVLPTQLTNDPEGKILRVRLIQKDGASSSPRGVGEGLICSIAGRRATHTGSLTDPFIFPKYNHTQQTARPSPCTSSTRAPPSRGCPAARS